jgi:hypothetical protein
MIRLVAVLVLLAIAGDAQAGLRDRLAARRGGAFPSGCAFCPGCTNAAPVAPAAPVPAARPAVAVPAAFGNCPDGKCPSGRVLNPVSRRSPRFR